MPFLHLTIPANSPLGKTVDGTFGKNSVRVTLLADDRLRIEPWWSNSNTTRLVLSEYFKYLFAHVRMRFDSAAVETERTRLADAVLGACCQ